MKPVVSLIAAVQASDLGIGYKNNLLIKISNDLKRFKQLTLNKPIIMGRKTFESIGTPLPNRINIVVTRNRNYKHDGIIVVHSFDEALEYAHSESHSEIFIIGGEELFKQSLPYADKLYLTRIDSHFPADTFFPHYDDIFTTIIENSRHVTPDGIAYEYMTLAR